MGGLAAGRRSCEARGRSAARRGASVRPTGRRARCRRRLLPRELRDDQHHHEHRGRGRGPGQPGRVRRRSAGRARSGAGPEDRRAAPASDAASPGAVVGVAVGCRGGRRRTGDRSAAAATTVGRRRRGRPGCPRRPTGPPRSAAAKAAAEPNRAAGSLASAHPDGLAQVLGDLVGQRRRVVAQVGQRGGDRAVGVERPAAGEALVEHHAEGVDVAGRGGRACPRPARGRGSAGCR